MDNSILSSPVGSTQVPPPLNGTHQVLREALDNACGLLGGMTSWLARHDASGYHALIRLDPAFGIDSDMHTALEIMAVTWPQEAVHVKPWQGYTLLFTSFPVQREECGGVYSLGMLFTGWFELTERSTGVVEGLRCCVRALFSRSLPALSPNLPTKVQMPAVVCSCCRRTQSPQYGWMHWDDLRFIETGLACSHTVCERCAADLYEDVLRTKE